MALKKPLKDPKAPCSHKSKHRETNRKGNDFWECDSCGAFLGWA